MIERIRTGKGASFAATLLILIGSAAALAGIDSQINAVLSQKHCRGVDFGIRVLEAGTGRVIYDKNGDDPMIPASNMKLVTSAAAMYYLGSDYEFKTRLCLIDDDVVIVGGGDPLLGDREYARSYGKDPDWVIDDMVGRLAAKGITSVGDIILDSTFFDDNRVHPAWPVEQLNQSYAAEISGISYSNNCVRMTVERKGSRAVVSMEPESDYLTIVNQVRVTNSGSSAAGAYRSSTPNKLYVRGRCRTATGFDVAIERPALFLGAVLKKRVEKAGIDVTGEVYEKFERRNPDLQIVAEYRTPLVDVLKRCNKDSLNMAAESLVKTISAERTSGNINGEWEHGLVLIGRYLESLGVEKDEYVLDDGCGLSRNNRISTHAISAVLKHTYGNGNWDVFKDTLAVGGVDGTIAKYFREPRYKGKIFGKTGYISGVRAFSGVAGTESADFLFSILTRGGSSYVRRAINDIAEIVADCPATR